MIRLASIAVLLTGALCLTAIPADARRKTAPAPADDASSKKADAGAGKPVEVGTFGDWGAYMAKGKSKTCYALAKPKDRRPEGKKDSAYVFIADRPGEKVHHEVSIMMGFPIKEGAAAQAKVGSASFDLVAKGSNAWIKNQAEESKFVEALQHSAKLFVKAPPLKGPTTTDSYSLAGLKQALERVSKDCK